MNWIELTQLSNGGVRKVMINKAHIIDFHTSLTSFGTSITTTQTGHKGRSYIFEVAETYEEVKRRLGGEE